MTSGRPLSVQLTFVPDPSQPARGRIVAYAAAAGDDPTTSAGQWGFPVGLVGELVVAVPGGEGLEVRTVRCVSWPVLDAVGPLLDLRPDAVHGWRRPPDSVLAWALAARAGVRAVRAERLAPALVDTEDVVTAAWRVLVGSDPALSDALDALAAALPPAAHAAVTDADAVGADARVLRPRRLLREFCDAIADAAVRDGAVPPPASPPRDRMLPWTARWVEALGDPRDPVVPLGRSAADRVASVADWLVSTASEGSLAVLSLEPPDDADGPWHVAFSVRTADEEEIPAAEVWAAQRTDDPVGIDLAESLLRGLGRAARLLPELAAALHVDEPQGVDLDVDAAWRLVDGVAPVLIGTDVEVIVPDGLGEAAPRIRLRVGAPPEDAPVGPDVDQPSAPPEIGPDAGRGAFSGLLAGFSWEVALGDEVLSAEEFALLVDSSAPLVRWRDTWVRVDGDLAERVAGLGEPGELGFGEALALALGGSVSPEVLEAAGDEPVEVVADGAIAELLARVRDTAERPPVPASPSGFEGELRPYQQRGVAWLRGMGELGLGAVLADDMGLGKTIQLLAYVIGMGRGPFLVVCPTSVVGNWAREIGRFAPDLPITRFHGPDRPRDLTGVDGVVLTSYGVVRRDVEALESVEWTVVALDEAQHIKNPSTAGAKAVRRLRANHVVALTGTPLENRLAELWSLMDVTNPGLLGTRASFGRRFVAPVERDGDRRAAERLRRLVAPFVLRRSKTDPDVVDDLPEKLERTVVCGLTSEQAALYQAAVDRTLGQGLAEASTMERRGRVLALLTELKQICNHPAQYLRRDDADQASAVLVGRSGKLAVAREIVREAVDGGEQVLVFTQFVAMGDLLVRQLEADLGTEVPFLHGGVPASARDTMVARFQGEEGITPPVLVVSLRAGGTGLNLTAATHVLHYDRWWNPAVEDQATDRAHRIGQRRTVEVHKLVTSGTVEERVAELLERKRALADAVVGAGEAWITELADEDLRELVALSASSGDDADDDGWDDEWEATG